MGVFSIPQIKLGLVIIELMVTLLSVYVYLNLEFFFLMYAPLLLVFHLLTLLPFPYVFRRVKGRENEDVFHEPVIEEKLDGKVGLWEMTAIGYFFIVNLVLIIFISVLIF